MSIHFVDNYIFKFDEKQISLIYAIKIYYCYFFLKTYYNKAQFKNVNKYYKQLYKICINL